MLSSVETASVVICLMIRSAESFHGIKAQTRDSNPLTQAPLPPRPLFPPRILPPILRSIPCGLYFLYCAAPGARFREAVGMGSFTGGSRALADAIDSLREEFGPDRYNVLTRNCNTFSSALCE